LIDLKLTCLVSVKLNLNLLTCSSTGADVGADVGVDGCAGASQRVCQRNSMFYHAARL